MTIATPATPAPTNTFARLPSLGLASWLIALCPALPGCGSDDANDELGSDDTGSSDTDGSSDDGTTDTGSTDTGSTDTGSTESTDEGPLDSDSDGIEDSLDNCPDDANPNQLDFDADGAGNVCDPLEFTGVSGTLVSEAQADAGFAGSCTIPIDFISTGGSIHVQLDDDAQLVRIELTEMTVADILDKECNLGFITATVSIKDFVMENGGDPFPVAIAHDQAAHVAGTASGTTDVPHPILATGTIEASTNGDPPMSSPLELMDAKLPPMAADVAGAGSSMTLSFADDEFVVATAQFDVTMPVMLTIDMMIVGVNGTLTLVP